MALVRLDNSIVSIHNRIGGVYFKNDISGQHVQAMPRTTRRIYTASRGNYVINFSEGVGTWRLIQRLLLSAFWVAFGLIWYIINKKHERQRLSGYGWTLRFNVPRFNKKYQPYLYPPKSPFELPAKAVGGGVIAFGAYIFYTDGLFEGELSYVSQGAEWYIWNDGEAWIISRAKGHYLPLPYWYRRSFDINGEFLASDPRLDPTRLSD